jgi:hypothetical protein
MRHFSCGTVRQVLSSAKIRDRLLRVSGGRAVLVIAVTVALVVVAAAPQAARASGCGPGLLGSSTRWKDRNAVFDFAGVCDWHDRCYGARGYGYDPVAAPARAATPYPRDWCDSGFHHGMRASCGRKPPRSATAPLCKAVAEVFYGLVTTFGGPWYRRADGHRTLMRLIWP